MHPLLLILFTTIFDRLRGSGKFPKAICQILYGLVIGVFLKQDWKFVVPFTILFVAGVSPGWGQPLGAYLGSRPPELEKAEWWQFGELPEKPFESVIIRGLIWALPSVLLVAWYPVVLAFSIAILIAFPLAAIICRKRIKMDSEWWDWHEVLRGFLVGVLTVLFKTLTDF